MLASWVARDCIHGYEPEAEAHHGTEPFLLFLPRYLGLFPDDEKAKGLLEDAAHHVGNWIAETPAWFDWERNRFYSYYTGNRTVKKEKEFANEMPDHWRFIHIALAAHRTFGEEKYLDWALRYGRRRAEMIVEIPEGPLPVMWDADGVPVWAKRFNDLGKKITGKNFQDDKAGSDSFKGIEVLLASGVVYVLGDLYQASGEKVFQDAAKRIVEPLVPDLHDPYLGPGAAAISPINYRSHQTTPLSQTTKRSHYL